MDDACFAELIQLVADQYELEPDLADEVLQRILNILFRCDPKDEYS